MPEIELTPQQALEHLKSGSEVMVTPYGDDDPDMFTGITIQDFDEDTDEEILDYLKSKNSLQLWL